MPLSYDNEEIAKVLKAKGVQFAGPLKYSRARTPDNKLTNFKTGDRFIDIVVPSEPLPKKVEVGIFNASLYHKEQKLAKDDIECGNCMMKGHLRKDCKIEVVCYQCRNVGTKEEMNAAQVCKASLMRIVERVVMRTATQIQVR